MCLQYTDMPQIIQIAADIHAISSGKEKQDILSGLDPSKTAVFFGINEAPECSILKRWQYRRRVRCALKKLLKMEVTVILAETSTLFGYYALDGLIQQRGKHHFSLLAIQVEGNRYHWMHTNKELARERALRNIHNFICCDNIISPISKDDWLDLLGGHVCHTITEKPYRTRNVDVLSPEASGKRESSLDEEKAQEMIH